MLLNIVTDDELLTSQVVKGILLCLIAVGIVFNFFKIIRTGPAKKKIINSVFFIILSIGIVLIYKQYRIEGSLLKDPKYVQGKTIRFCNVFALGQGVLFEYEVNGQTYRCCNTFHPVPVDSILVPGGIFMVRYSDKFPEKGRMDFTKKINE
ncbi:MAG: hypothetical protein IPL97_04575 [Niastella sp.]|nr:hypothetical protein [Niastella sp.]